MTSLPKGKSSHLPIRTEVSLQKATTQTLLPKSF